MGEACLRRINPSGKIERMPKRFAILLFATTLFAQHHPEPPAAPGKAALIPGMGKLHHAVSTKNATAQQFFDQGLSLVYGFNHEAAVKSFERAGELDPQLAMAWWGIGYALGTNINLPLMEQNNARAYAATKKALALKERASERERAYIDALAVRYEEKYRGERADLDRKYMQAMRRLTEQYPDDLDAAALYAESIMNLNPWKLWSHDGKPAEGTEEAIRVLESVIARDPEHMGANHYYIHAVEASPFPERSLASANRLGALAPAAGHLVHMPAHTYMRLGDYDSAARVNIAAAEADRQYFLKAAPGVYTTYYTHNVHFLSAALTMQGRNREALAAARRTAAVIKPVLSMDPGFEKYSAMPILTLIRTRQWADILALPEPAADQVSTCNLRHFAMGLAQASRGTTVEAEQELTAFEKGVAALPKERSFGLNPESDVMKIAVHVLTAKIAQAKHDDAKMVEELRAAVLAEDALGYDEPADWYYPPTREALGAALLMSGNAEGAERVFREDLRDNWRNGRSLFGLMEALKKEGNSDEAALLEPQFRAAWAKADAPLTLADLF
jgi:tetratricopeptide (TPR) repeat protein